MKTGQEQNSINYEDKTMNKKLAELSDEELKQVSSGSAFYVEMPCGKGVKYNTYCNSRDENNTTCQSCSGYAG